MYENDDDQPIPQYDGDISLESNDSKKLESCNESIVIEPSTESENESVPQLIPVIVT